MRQKYIAAGGFKVEEKSLWKLRNELMMYSFPLFVVSYC